MVGENTKFHGNANRSVVCSERTENTL